MSKLYQFVIFISFHLFLRRTTDLRYGELELFLYGLELPHLLPVFRKELIDLPMLFTLTEKDLQNVRNILLKINKIQCKNEYFLVAFRCIIFVVVLYTYSSTQLSKTIISSWNEQGNEYTPCYAHHSKKKALLLYVLSLTNLLISRKVKAMLQKIYIILFQFCL